LYGGLDVLEDVREVMDDDHRASGIDVEVTCEDCNETFLVTDVDNINDNVLQQRSSLPRIKL
jgi:formylmethanofuran dehydrogenase subunit E